MTAVNWLEEAITENLKEIITKCNVELMESLFKQAKKIEKKQIMDAWLTKKPTTFNGWKNEFEQYYNETFKSE